MIRKVRAAPPGIPCVPSEYSNCELADAHPNAINVKFSSHCTLTYRKLSHFKRQDFISNFDFKIYRRELLDITC